MAEHAVDRAPGPKADRCHRDTGRRIASEYDRCDQTRTVFVNLSQCGLLTTASETGVWYRAIEPQYWRTALQSSQTVRGHSRFSAGAAASPPLSCRGPASGAV